MTLKVQREGRGETGTLICNSLFLRDIEKDVGSVRLVTLVIVISVNRVTLDESVKLEREED